MLRLLQSTSYVTLVLLLTSCTGDQGVSDDKNIKLQSPDSLNSFANIEFNDDFFDFGTVVHGELVAHTFSFRNTGNEALVIKDVIPGCGCTKAELSARVLRPGEEGKIEIVFDSRGWQGLQYKSVTLRTNSPIREKSVTIKASVVEPKE